MSKAAIRVIPREKEKEKAGAGGARSIKVLLSLGDKAGVLSEEEKVALVDYGYERDKVVKGADKDLKIIKPMLLEDAKSQKWKEFAGNAAVCKIGSGTSTEIEPKALALKLKELGKTKMFSTFFKVKIGDVKKYLGIEAIKDITTTDKIEYKSVSFRNK